MGYELNVQPVIDLRYVHTIVRSMKEHLIVSLIKMTLHYELTAMHGHSIRASCIITLVM